MLQNFSENVGYVMYGMECMVWNVWYGVRMIVRDIF